MATKKNRALSSLLLRINQLFSLLIAFSLLLANASTWIAPSTLVFPSYFGLGFPFLFFLNLMYLVFWIIKRKWTFLIAVAALLISYPNYTHTIRIKSAQLADLPQENLKVMSYNIRYFDRFNWSGEEDTRRLLMNYILESEADVICLQEYIPLKQDKNYLEFMRRMREKGYADYYESNDPKSGVGLITFSRYPILSRETIHFESSYNSAIYTDIKVDFKRIRIYNAHLQSIYFDKDEYALFERFSLQERDENMKKVRRIWSLLSDAWIKREAQAKLLHESMVDSPYPLILAADFNDSPVSYTYKTMEEGFNDAFLESGTGLSKTYTQLFPGLRIDFLFHSQDIQSFEYQVDRVGYSDHFPIHAHFSIPEK